MFTDIKKKVADRFDAMCNSGKRMLVVDYNRDTIWDQYIDGFSDDTKQEHNCNCCKAFIRQIGAVVIINDDLSIGTIWDIDVEDEYSNSVNRLAAYVRSLPIKGLFSHKERVAGTDKNHDAKRDVIWQHFFVKIPNAVWDRSDTFATKSSRLRDCKNSLKRAVEEISDDAINTVLEVIAQGSLYRGPEYKKMITNLKATKKAYGKLTGSEDSFFWIKATTLPESSSCIRGSAIGTLLLDLSGGRDLESSVKAFERMVAPANYKRPTALVTPRMIEDAKKKLGGLNLIGALNRRKLDYRDITADNAIFTHRPKPAVSDVFGELINETSVNANELKRVEEIGIKDFIDNVLTNAAGVRILFGGNHTGNLSTLTGPVDSDEKSLFKWDNSFGWSYSGGVADSVKERVKAAGGRVDGWLRFSLEWYNYDDLDIHLKGPCGHIHYGNKTTPYGSLDVDMNAGGRRSKEPVENIIFTRQLPPGNYEVKVNNYSTNAQSDKGFSVQMEHNGVIQNFSSLRSPSQSRYSEPICLTVDGHGGVVVKDNDFSKSGCGVTKWGVTTGQWQSVRSILRSPNHWNKPIGNKHWFFILDGCVSDEETRPFYNEFLCEDLAKNRKVMETLGGKIKVADAEGPELSGLGFSETIRNEFYAEVQGAFKRIVKVKI